MIESSDLIRLLKDKSMDFTEEELEKIIEAESNKDESEMDTDLIECCIDALNEKRNPVAVSKKKSPIRRILFFASAAAVLILVNLFAFQRMGAKPPVADSTDVAPATTAVSEETTTTKKPSSTMGEISTKPTQDSDSLPDKGKEPSEADTSQKGHPATSSPFDLKKQLEKHGFKDVVLPAAILESSKKIPVNFKNNSALFSVQAYSKVLNVTISESKTVDPEVTEENTSSETINVNGISVLVTNKNGISTISYESGNNAYKIVLNSTLEEATVIAEKIQ